MWGRGDYANLFESQTDPVQKIPWNERMVKAFEACAVDPKDFPVISTITKPRKQRSNSGLLCKTLFWFQNQTVIEDQL